MAFYFVVILFIQIVARNETDKIGFIHITKVGGTAIEKSSYWKYLQTFGHKPTLQNFSTSNDRAICVVREPIDRFISIYTYWRYGSDMYEREPGWIPPINGINEFINAASDINHEFHSFVQKTMTSGRGFTWEAHFYPQAHWIGGRGARENIVIIRYSPNSTKFANRIQSAFSSLGFRDRAIISVVNKSSKSLDKSDSMESLTLESRAWIREHYRKDFRLWAQINKQHQTGRGPWRAVF